MIRKIEQVFIYHPHCDSERSVHKSILQNFTCHTHPNQNKPIRGTFGVMVIMVGNGNNNQSSNPGPGFLVFHIVIIPLGKVCNPQFSVQLWVNGRADWTL